MRCKSCARADVNRIVAPDKPGTPTQEKRCANVLLTTTRPKGMMEGESNGEFVHGKQSSDERVWVAMVYSMHLPRHPGSDSRHRFEGGVSMSRKLSIPYDRREHRGLRSRQRWSTHDLTYE